MVTDRVSDYLFAPSQDAVANLRAEGGPDTHLVGNVMVDTLLANLDLSPRAGHAGQARGLSRAVTAWSRCTGPAMDP